MNLEALGFSAYPVLSKVRWNKTPEQDTTYTHVAVVVTPSAGPEAGWKYLVDVGFGGIGSMYPLRLDVSEPQPTPDGGVYRVVPPAPGGLGFWMLQWQVKGEWRDLYKFRDEPASDIDQELSNWWSCSHPTARFCTSFFAARVVGPDRHHILNGEYVIRHADGTADTTAVADGAHLLSLLSSVFGLNLPAADAASGSQLFRYLPPRA